MAWTFTEGCPNTFRSLSNVFSESLPACLFLQGALVEPLANAVHVLTKCPSVAGQTGLVYGVGPIGVLVYLVARHFGARLLDWASIRR